MSSSLRSRRMKRNHKRGARPARLNLVALMDIFTILVLFLMVNNGDVEILQSDKTISLPESVSEQKPALALTIRINGRVAGTFVRPNRKGWQPWRVDTKHLAGQIARVTFAVTSSNAGARHYCFDAHVETERR